MSPSFTIKSNQVNELPFVVRADNLGADADIRFVIHETDYDITIHCKKSLQEDKWIATIPPLNTKLTEANFDIEITSEEYFFRPASGTLKILQPPSVEMSESKEHKDRPRVTIDMNETIVKRKTLAEFSKMTVDDKKDFMRTVKNTSKILETAANVMQSLSTGEHSKISSKSILTITEASKKAIASIEGKIWKD
jgi:hypothetical protein